jgi:tetratricopeptide (TPR) repeat protein
MKNKKHLWITVTAVALVSAMLVACGGGGEPPTPTPVPPTPTLAATPTPSASEHVAQGMAYVEQGKLDEAIVEFEQAIELDPDNADAHRNLGTAYGEQGQWEKAVVPYEKAIELDPDFGEAYGDLVGAYFSLGKVPEAIAAGEKAIELAPEYSTGYNNLGIVYGAQGKLDEAIALFKKAIQANPADADAHYNLGFAYENLNQLDEAIAEYQAAIQADPDYADAHENLGSVLARQNQIEKAIAEWEETIKIDPERATAYKSLGTAYAMQGQSDKAVAAFETYLQLATGAPDRVSVEQEIAKLKGPAAGPGAEYRNAEGGYSLRYPEGWYYAEDKAQVTFAKSKEAMDAPEGTPTVIFIAGPLSEIAKSLNVERVTDPVVALKGMAQSLKLEMGQVETGKIANYPAALTSLTGTSKGVSYQGGLAVALVEGKAIYGLALAPPDQWEAFRPTYINMVNSLSFSPPGYRNAKGGYSVVYPGEWSYEESGTMVTLATSKEAIEAPAGTALKEGPLVVFDASPLTELAGKLGVKDTSDPEAFVQAMAAAFDAEVGGVETGQIAGYPTAYANISGVYEGASYKGGLVAVLVEERVIGGYIMAPPDQWGTVRPIFSDMLDSLSFFEP